MSHRRIHVAMPETDMYGRKSVPRDELVMQFGSATVDRAEVATILNIMFVTGMVKPQEFVDVMVQQCRRIEEIRRRDAMLEEDKG